MIEIGITATRRGATDAQIATLTRMLRNLYPVALHHGDCVGGDEDAHNVAVSLKIRTVAHPPDITKLRAWCLADRTKTPAPYLKRNEDIVHSTNALFAMPRQDKEPDAKKARGSGTWYTVRFARKIGRPVTIIWPDGSVPLEEQ